MYWKCVLNVIKLPTVIIPGHRIIGPKRTNKTVLYKEEHIKKTI